MQNPLPGQITQVKTMARGVRVIFDSQETLSPEQTAELFQLYDKLGWFFFLKSPEAKIDVASLPPIELEEGEKSPGQRLRASLYVCWEQKMKGKMDFELFYRQQMERIINRVKETLN